YVQVIETGNPIDDKVKLMYKGKEYFFLVGAFKIGEGLGLSGKEFTENISNLNELGTTLSLVDIVNRKSNGWVKELDKHSCVQPHEEKTH
ncbi:MAG: hypothetical protein HKN31_04295, partial [Pricia sp.]|nr:hypothetical protein [Pricia sp.]